MIKEEVDTKKSKEEKGEEERIEEDLNQESIKAKKKNKKKNKKKKKKKQTEDDCDQTVEYCFFPCRKYYDYLFSTMHWKSSESEAQRDND